jgi:hypothetical protein
VVSGQVGQESKGPLTFATFNECRFCGSDDNLTDEDLIPKWANEELKARSGGKLDVLFPTIVRGERVGFSKDEGATQNLLWSQNLESVRGLGSNPSFGDTTRAGPTRLSDGRTL